MSELIERIKNRIKILDKFHDGIVNLYEAIKIIDEESAKEPQECKNVSPLNDVDEFKCSECGIIMQDLVRKIVDEEGTYYSEYAFRYCPNCGRKIKVSNDNY